MQHEIKNNGKKVHKEGVTNKSNTKCLVNRRFLRLPRAVAVPETVAELELAVFSPQLYTYMSFNGTSLQNTQRLVHQTNPYLALKLPREMVQFQRKLRNQNWNSQNLEIDCPPKAQSCRIRKDHYIKQFLTQVSLLETTL